MGIPINDPADPAGYDCNYSSSKTATSCKCSCSCSSNSNSSASSNSDSNSSSSCNSSKSDSNSSSSCNSSSNSSSNSSNGKHSKNAGATTLTLTFANNNSCGAAHTHQYSKTETLDAAPTAYTRQSRDLVGNSKEYRIECNKSDLRIIGNGNRIRIGCNRGNLQIIGNNTRLKITNNTGGIRYTGNEGRICLGSDSQQQIVDYIGSNGKLKVVKAADLLNEKIKSHKQKAQKSAETATAATCAEVPSTEGNVKSHSTAKKVKVKSASFAGDFSAQWRQFNELFEKHGWRNSDCASMPNLQCAHVAQADAAADGKKAEQSNSSSSSNKSSKSSSGSTKIHTKSCKIDNNINIVSAYGNICIKNAVNVSM